MKECNEKIICLNCGWSGLENELKLIEATFIANCPEEVEVCPKCLSAELKYDCNINYIKQCEKESNHLTNNNNQFEDLFVVGKRKGEWDFSIKTTIASLSYVEMNKFRSMIIVAIGAAENMWKRYQIQNEQKQAKNKERN